MRLTALPLVFVLALSGATTPAYADVRVDAAADIIACSVIHGDKARLKCFERSVKTMRDAFPEAQDLAQTRITEVRAAAHEEAKEEFGLPPAVARANDPFTENDFGIGNVQREARAKDRDDDDEEKTFGDVKSISSGVVEVGRNLRGKIIVILENGQVWTQINADRSRPYIPKNLEGVTATVKKAALGSYRIRISSSRDAFKARRIK